MTPKEFLKPTWKKILFFLIIFIFFVPFIELRTELVKDGITYSSSLMILSALLYAINLMGGGAYIESINYLTLVLGIISSYILSSFFITFYSKSKKGR